MIARYAFLALSLGAVVIGGCKSDPYCLNCNNGDVDLAGGDGPVGAPDLAGADFATIPDLFGQTCVISNTGVEICDGLDNDCNGVVDDVSPTKLAADPNNCGVCGKICNFTGQKQFGVCDSTSGTPTCKPGACLPGFVDTDGDPSNGCDYACTPTNGGVELCDNLDNNCDKVIDEGFMKATDPLNCGGCGIVCPAISGNSVGSCVGSMCQAPICNAGYKNLDGNPLNGCEYQCPVFPTVPETCNNVDDDCDGVKDNAPTDVGVPCSNFCGIVAACVAGNTCSFPLSTNHGLSCYGQCMPGATICSAGNKICQAAPPLPALEKCNGTDDNCDGQIDEGFNTQTDPLNCNACGNKCTATSNLASVLAYKCTTGSCGIQACTPGFRDLNGVFADGCEYQCPVYPTTTESCNGKDDDCDGLVDEIAGTPGPSPSFITAPGNFCFQGSICSGAAPVCCGAAGWLCDYKSTNAGIEIQEAAPLACKRASDGASRQAGTLVFSELKCDNLDGDCRNGADDSFLQKGKACTVGVGKCAGASNFVCGGTSVVGACAGSTAGTVCCPTAAVPANAAAEECNGADDNCDGQIDERTPSAVGGPYLAGYVDRFVKVSSAPNLWVYAYEASRLDSTSLIGGTNSAGRACSKPTVVPWSSVTRPQAAAACNTIVLSDGSTRARLCSSTEWQNTCESFVAKTNSYSYSSAATVYLSGACNDVNRQASPAVWVTGFDNGKAKKCYTDYAAAGKVADLSGNLMEWTSTSVLVGATTYYKVRGGAFNSPSDGTPPDGTSCEFDFNILPDTFANSDVGFRCCADVAP